MMKKRIIPFLMLHRGQLHKSVQFSDFTYIGDPLIAVKIFNEKQAEEVCIVDIDPSRYGTPIQYDLLKDIAGECFMPLSYGGGINSIEAARKILYSGFEKIIVNSEIHTQGSNFVRELVKEFGSSTVVAGVDYKHTSQGNCVFSHGGQRNTGKELFRFTQEMQDLGVGELVLNSVDRDGTMTGLDSEAIALIASNLKIPMIACGGTDNLEEISKGLSAGASAVAAGSLFVYKGPLKAVLINYPDKSVANKIKMLGHGSL